MEAQFPQVCGGGKGVGIVGAHLERAARQQHDRAFGLHACPDGDGGEIGTKIRFVKIAPHILGKNRFGRGISLFPQVQCLYTV